MLPILKNASSHADTVLGGEERWPRPIQEKEFPMVLLSGLYYRLRWHRRLHELAEEIVERSFEPMWDRRGGSGSGHVSPGIARVYQDVSDRRDPTSGSDSIAVSGVARQLATATGRPGHRSLVTGVAQRADSVRRHVSRQPPRGGTSTSTKRCFRLLTYTLKSSRCVALLDVVEKSSIGQNATTTSRSASAVTEGVRPTNTAWNRGWSCGLVTTSDSKQCHTFKNATSQA